MHAFIADELGATTQIKCFFNKLKRFRRIALRYEKTLTTCMECVHLAYVVMRLR
ncbi:transposase [Acetobacter lovaniensis]|nr:transposase [Acetobacter lovaniensis]